MTESILGKMNSVEVLAMPTSESPLEWSDQLLSLAELEGQREPPMVVRLKEDGSTVDFHGKMDTCRPLLVYSKRRRSTLAAECLHWKKGKFAAVGSLLEIPKDYAGWFQIVSNPKDAQQQRFHATIAGIARTACDYFLTRTQIVAFRGRDDDEATLSLEDEVKVFPGEILKVKCCVVRKWKLHTDESKASLTAAHAQRAETKLLQCVDLHGRPLYLPHAHPGIFHVIVQKGLEDHSTVYQIEDFLKEKRKLPFNVQLVFGWPPKTAYEFQGFVRLLHKRRPDTFVVRGFGKSEHSVVEVPLDIDWKVQHLLNMEKLKGSELFANAVRQCRNKVYAFLTSMKTLDVPYKCRDLGGQPATSSESGVSGRMTSPMDMSKFNPLDVFPSADLEEKAGEVSESWSLSFRDPQPEADDLPDDDDDGILLENKESSTRDFVDDDESTLDGTVVKVGSHKAVLYRNRKASIQNKTRRLSLMSTTSATSDAQDLRAVKERSRSKRVSKC